MRWLYHIGELLMLDAVVLVLTLLLTVMTLSGCAGGFIAI
jgi:hypothetical protein